MKGRLLLLALVLLAVPAQGAINGPKPFDADYGFAEDLERDPITVVSGSLRASLPAVGGAFGFFDTTGLLVNGLTRVCWTGAGTDCIEATGLAIRVPDGGSAGMDLPDAADVRFEADHALGFFIDFASDEDLNSFALGRTLAAPSVGGLVTFDDIRSIPISGFVPDAARTGGFVALDDQTGIQILQNGIVREDFQGKQVALTFEGDPTITPFGTEFAILPFEDGSDATFTRADSDAAKEGLRLDRVQQLLGEVDAANQDSADQGDNQGVASGTEDFEAVLSEVLNGAMLRVPTAASSNAAFERDFAFAGFDHLAVSAVGSSLTWNGDAALQIQEGSVKGAPDLIGFSFFKLPWWSFLLWGIALATWITRLALHPPKEHPVWDRYKWIGWIFGPVCFIILFILWDFEVRSVWGTSLFSTDTAGVGLAVTAAVQIAPLFFVTFAVAAPLRMIFRNGLLLGRQGTFMGLSGGVAYLLSYAIGATLLLSYIELILVTILENVGG